MADARAESGACVNPLGTPKAILGAVLAALVVSWIALAQFAFGQANPAATGFTGGPPLVACGSVGSHLCGTGAQPVVSGCGTSPVVSGSDTVGNVVTGATATACVITFVTPYAAPPNCSVDGQVSTPSFTVSRTAITMTAVIAAGNYSWLCLGLAGNG